MDGAVEGTLDLIDGALRDYETSGDAIRWTPDEGAREVIDGKWSQIQGMTPSLVIYDEVRTVMYASALERLVDDFAAWGNAYIAATAPALRSLSEDLGRLFSAVVENSTHTVHAIYYPRQHVRCHDCHPIANPRPLAISGDTYRRRQKGRRRR